MEKLFEEPEEYDLQEFEHLMRSKSQRRKNITNTTSDKLSNKEDLKKSKKAKNPVKNNLKRGIYEDVDL